MNVFLGVDLGWYGKPSGLASIILSASGFRIHRIDRVEVIGDILGWIEAEVGAASAVIAIDAPTVIPNASGIRRAERALNAEFRRFHAGCHPANLGRPFAAKVIEFSDRLARLGFVHGATLEPRQRGRFQIEVHPHAAAVSFFDLDRIVKYKRGLREERARELRRLRRLMLSHLPRILPDLSLHLPSIPRTGNLKPVEDRIDAVLCAAIAAHWWLWGSGKNHLYGDEHDGFIIVPHRYPPHSEPPCEARTR